MSDLYVEKGGKKLRCGYTTGSCAAAAAKAAAIMLLEGGDITNVTIQTPNGHLFVAEVTDVVRDADARSVSCAVTKDSGDEPDVTDGLKIYAAVSLDSPSDEEGEKKGIIIEGGEGIGIVTRPGLPLPIGSAAIYPIPREMICKSIEEVLRHNYVIDKQVRVVISAPDATELVDQTFNPKLGIVGGISILGNTGIIEPLSNEMLLYSIKSEIGIRRAEGEKILLLSPNGCGIQYIADRYGVDGDKAVLCYNLIYDAVVFAKNAGFSRILLVGRMGNLAKVSDGVKNTHQRLGDRRMEIISEITSLFMKKTTPVELLDNIRMSKDFDNTVRIITEAGLQREVFAEMAVRIKYHVEDWTDGAVRVEVILFNNDESELMPSLGARDMLRKLRKQAEASGLGT